MISLARNKIEDVTVELTVEETIGSKIGGYPTLLIGDVNIESCMVAEVDTLAIIKAVLTSETAFDFEWKTRDCWNSKTFVTVLKACISWEYSVDPNLMVEPTAYNSVWQKAIREQDEIACDYDNHSPWDRTVAMAKIYDYRSHLTYVPIKKVISDE